MQLIDNWKQALSMTSVQVGGSVVILGLADQFVSSLQGVIPPLAYAVLGGLVMLARVVLQPNLSR